MRRLCTHATRHGPRAARRADPRRARGAAPPRLRGHRGAAGAQRRRARPADRHCVPRAAAARDRGLAVRNGKHRRRSPPPHLPTDPRRPGRADRPALGVDGLQHRGIALPRGDAVAGTLTADDPVEATVHDLGRRLHGPRRIRRSMLAEVEAGLRDTVDAQVAAGSAPDEARRRAVAEFGVPAELAPLYQAGIGVTQGRRTALLLALAFPGLLLGWDLLWALDGDGGAAPSPAVRLLSRVMDGTSLAVGVAAALLVWLLTSHGRAGRNTRGVARTPPFRRTSRAQRCSCRWSVRSSARWRRRGDGEPGSPAVLLSMPAGGSLTNGAFRPLVKGPAEGFTLPS